MTDITLSNLVATPGLGQVILTWDYNDPNSPSTIAAVEIWMAKSNDFALASNFGDGDTLTSRIHIVTSQGGSNYYWIIARDASGNHGPKFPSGDNAGVQSTANNIPNVPGLNFNLINGSLVASVASNALSIAIKTASGADPSPSAPVLMVVSGITGAYSVLPIAAAASVTLSSGSTIGAISTTPFRLWIVGFDDGGTFRLGVICCSTSTAIFPLTEFGVGSSTAEGGAGAADSAGVMYTGAAVTSKPFRILGYMDWNSGLTTAGTWAAVPDLIQMFGPGIKCPGEVVQEKANYRSDTASGTTTIPFDDTIPQNTEGDEYFSTSFTQTSKVNIVEHEAVLQCSTTAGSNGIFIMALFRDSVASALAAASNVQSEQASGASHGQIHFKFRHRPVLDVAATYKIRAGTTPIGINFYLNGAVSRFLGGVMWSHHTIKEYQG